MGGGGGGWAWRMEGGMKDGKRQRQGRRTNTVRRHGKRVNDGVGYYVDMDVDVEKPTPIQEMKQNVVKKFGTAVLLPVVPALVLGFARTDGSGLGPDSGASKSSKQNWLGTSSSSST